MALQAAQQLTPSSVVIQQFYIDGLPLYNFDFFSDQQPTIVEQLSEAITSADALIFDTPEYNFSIPVVLKNALDFPSKHQLKALENKPVGIMSAGPGMLGAVRAQYYLRRITVAVNAIVLNQAEIMITQANTNLTEWVTC